MRIGHGYDAHKLVPGSFIILGGLKKILIPGLMVLVGVITT